MDIEFLKDTLHLSEPRPFSLKITGGGVLSLCLKDRIEAIVLPSLLDINFEHLR